MCSAAIQYKQHNKIYAKSSKVVLIKNKLINNNKSKQKILTISIKD